MTDDLEPIAKANAALAVATAANAILKAEGGIKKTGTYEGKSNREGGGGRFAQMVDKLEGKVDDPEAVAASIARKKYGKRKLQKYATAGRKRAAKEG